MLISKIEELAQKRVDTETKEGRLIENAGEAQHKRQREIEDSLFEVVDEQLDKMICKMEGKKFIRSAYYLATQLLTRTYNQGIHVSSEEVSFQYPKQSLQLLSGSLGVAKVVAASKRWLVL